MRKTLLTVMSAVIVITVSCSSVNFPQHKSDGNIYRLTAAPKPYETGDPASAKYRAYVAPYKVVEERYGKNELRTVDFAEFIKAALARKFGGKVAFVDQAERAGIVINMKDKINGFKLKSSAILYITAKVNGTYVTAKGEVYYRKPHWPPSTDDVAGEVDAAVDALVSVLKEMPDGSIGVSALSISADKDAYYFSQRNGKSVMEGPLGYNVEKRVEED